MCKTALNRFTSLTLSLLLGLGLFGCSSPNPNTSTSSEENIQPFTSFTSLNDPDLLQHTEDNVLAELESSLDSDDYTIEDIQVTYVSKEYLEELSYNTQSNIYFGYTLDEIEKHLGDQKYVFTVGENGETTVKGFENYDDTFEKVAANLAIGGGVILVCVAVTAATAGGAAPVTAPTVNMIFAASAETAAAFATGSGALGFIAGGATKAIETGGDIEEALKAAALEGSEGLKWGAIAGAATGALGSSLKLYKASKAIPSWRESEIRAFEKYPGEQQVSYFKGKRASNYRGATRPDIVVEEGGKTVAIEVKNYDLQNNFYNLNKTLERQVAERAQNLPSNSSQKIILDVKNRGYSAEFVEDKIAKLHETLSRIDPNIAIEVMG